MNALLMQQALNNINDAGHSEDRSEPHHDHEERGQEPAPEPAYEAPVESMPEPVYSAPEPAYIEPVSYSAPDPTPSYSDPSPSFDSGSFSSGDSGSF